MLLGGAVNLWMLLMGRFLTGVAGGMTAASIPVRYNGHIINTKKYKCVCNILLDWILSNVMFLCLSFLHLRCTSQRFPISQ